MQQMSSQILKFLSIDSQNNGCLLLSMIAAYTQVFMVITLTKDLLWKRDWGELRNTWSILFAKKYNHEDYFSCFPNNVNIMVSAKCYHFE